MNDTAGDSTGVLGDSLADGSDGGGLGTFCIYEASSPEKIREHALRVDMPATEIFEVADTVLVRPDPVAAAA